MTLISSSNTITILFQNSHRDIKDSIGNIMNNIIITMYEVGGALDLLGGLLHELYKSHCAVHLN